MSSRLRQAILQNDYSLVERVLKHNTQCLHNPDFANKSNTSLHLAAQHGLLEIAVSSLVATKDHFAEFSDRSFSYL